MALRLAEAGYAGGDPEKVMQMTVGWVVTSIQFQKHKADYERTYIELNRKRE